MYPRLLVAKWDGWCEVADRDVDADGLSSVTPGKHVRWSPSPALRLQLTGDVVSRYSLPKGGSHSLNEASVSSVGEEWDYREVCWFGSG